MGHILHDIKDWLARRCTGLQGSRRASSLLLFGSRPEVLCVQPDWLALQDQACLMEARSFSARCCCRFLQEGCQDGWSVVSRKHPHGTLLSAHFRWTNSLRVSSTRAVDGQDTCSSPSLYGTSCQGLPLTTPVMWNTDANLFEKMLL